VVNINNNIIKKTMNIGLGLIAVGLSKNIKII
jgi:hypothetical protein